jgi:hypothetical protein
MINWSPIIAMTNREGAKLVCKRLLMYGAIVVSATILSTASFSSGLLAQGFTSTGPLRVLTKEGSIIIILLLEQALVYIYQKVLPKLMVVKYGLRIISMEKEHRFNLVC